MTDVEIIEHWQGSPEWLAARFGIPTASNAAAITAGGEGKTRDEYMRKLAGEEIMARWPDAVWLASVIR